MTRNRKPPSELDLWRRALEGATGSDAWRGVRDLALGRDAGSPEFPDDGDRPPLGATRRDFFRLVGASAALAGLSACPSRPAEFIVPFADDPPEYVPGIPRHYATSLVMDGFATGVIAQSHEGRPTKLEGNPLHPASLGATTPQQQAAVLDVYLPSRLASVRHRGRPSTWRQLVEEFSDPGPRPWLVLPPQSSPLIAELIARLRSRSPGLEVCFHAPLSRQRVYQATQTAFGLPLEPQLDFTRADRALIFDGDLLASGPMSLAWARDFARRRRIRRPEDDPGRLYVVESSPTATSSLADHRLAVAPSRVEHVAAAVLLELVRLDPAGAPAGLEATLARWATAPHRAWARAVATDLRAHRRRALVAAGPAASVSCQLLVHAMSELLATPLTSFTSPALLEPLPKRSLADVQSALASGDADTVIVAELDPIYTAPARSTLGADLARARRTLHLTRAVGETSAACQWVAPAAHELESWGDARAYDGTLGLIQPLIEPLHGGRSLVELLAVLGGARAVNGGDLVRQYWRGSFGADDELHSILRTGVVPDSASPRVQVELSWSRVIAALRRSPPVSEPSLELAFEVSPAVYDGRFAGNGWLQEMPQPITSLTWGNAALIAPATAARLGIDTGDELILELGETRTTAPALILPGQAHDAVSLALGYGQRAADPVARDVGVNAYRLRNDASRFRSPLRITRTGRSLPVAITQEHWRREGRPLALHTTLAQYRATPDFTAEHRGPLPTLLPEPAAAAGELQWAMTIDTTICTGCSSCVVACQAENNIPVVGKEGVLRSREMHWLRIERYFSGPPSDPVIVHQPMACQHCEHAPCEYVCPVFATAHSPDGLNEMVYNRCIGTRFCSNNCPYKVRRFNFFDYAPARTELVALQKNPSVTVRARGVMEKCTYCVQRIRRAGIDARLDGRAIAPGEVRTACQEACPTEAIQFGSLHQRDTAVVVWRQEPRRYDVLHELGTRPRTTYLARIRNPNPEIGG